MFVVYDLACNGLREPCGVTGTPLLSWRLGADRTGARQVAWRVVVTSMLTGEPAWDSGRVFDERCRVAYGGKPLSAGEQCVWFVTVWSDANEQTHATPSAFVYGSPGDAPCSAWGRQRTGMIWTSDERLNDVLEVSGTHDRLRGTAAEGLVWSVEAPGAPTKHAYAVNDDDEFVRWAWRDVVGLASHWPDFGRVRLRVPATCELAFAQGTLMVPQGMLFVRWERIGAGLELRASLPPGVSGSMSIGVLSQEVGSGQHVLRTTEGGRP
ncbi:MAG: hypothetical protein J6S63_10560 [Atopobiaceae bacterium]|nr:hypothetical protein [Atopobiaceae bacterium]